MEEEDISKMVNMALDTEIQDREREIAEKCGAVPIEELPTNVEIDEVVDVLEDKDDKGKAEKYPELAEETTQLPPPVSSKRKKDDLIRDIMELQTKMGALTHTETALKRMKKADLEVLLVGLYAKGMEKAVGITEKNMGLATDAAESIFILNVALCKFIAMGCDFDAVKENTGGINVLENWHMDVILQKDELLPVLRQVCDENQVLIKKYFTPIYRYAGLIAMSGIGCATRNAKKKLNK